MKSPLSPSPTLEALEKLRDEEVKSLFSALKEVEENEKQPNAIDDLECVAMDKADITELRRILDKWVESLASCPEDAFRQGVASGLLEFDTYLEELEKQIKKIFSD